MLCIAVSLADFFGFLVVFRASGGEAGHVGGEVGVRCRQDGIGGGEHEDVADSAALGEEVAEAFEACLEFLPFVVPGLVGAGGAGA